MTSGVTSVISLKFLTKSFENVYLTYENSTKPIKEKPVVLDFLKYVSAKFIGNTLWWQCTLLWLQIIN